MSLTDAETHFEFGKNWRDYANTIDRRRIDAGIAGVRKLFPDGLSGKTFLDIGCGSGLHALAALELGAKSVLSIDIDENSVAATNATLSKFAPGGPWKAEVVSVFEATPEAIGATFDVVYSWGVLHHTGDMWRAIRRASDLVKDGGEFALAIYYATPLDAMWKFEKRIYSRSPQFAQWMMRQCYMSAVGVNLMVRGRNPIAYVRDYAETRGMNFSHDVHDWLGGYPYETASAEEIKTSISGLGFGLEREFSLVAARLGVFGSGCNEFVFRRKQAESAV